MLYFHSLFKDNEIRDGVHTFFPEPKQTFDDTSFFSCCAIDEGEDRLHRNMTVRINLILNGGVCLATRVRYRQSCGLDTWSALLAYLFVSRICVAGLCFCFFALVLFFPLPSDQIGGGFLVCYFFPLFLFFCLCFLDVAMVWKGKPASVTTGSRDRTYVRK